MYNFTCKPEDKTINIIYIRRKKLKKELNKKLYKFISSKGEVGVSFVALAKVFKDKKISKSMIDDQLRVLIKEKQIMFKSGVYSLYKVKNGVIATILRVKETFGIAKIESTGEEVFVPGRSLMGTLPGEDVLLSKLYSVTHDDAFEVVKIVTPITNLEFVGTVTKIHNDYYVDPDKFVQFPIMIARNEKQKVKEGDKVLAKIISRGIKHSDMKLSISMVYGSAGKACVCATAVLDSNGINEEFSYSVLDEAKRLSHKGIVSKDLFYRQDYRMNDIFTIDSADSKDLDDAISIEKMGDNYILGVHIADVSHYVRQGSELDKEAYTRGTSVYYANRVVPMLPKELSNGICSLNPNEDRLTLSILITLDLDGKLVDFDIQKSIINSRVKGVYSEINSILDGTATAEITAKYAHLADRIELMNELADILIANKKARGAPNIDKAESKVILNDDEYCIDIVPRQRGKSECIIEEFMLMANQAAALAAKMREIPYVYRVHEAPTPEKIETLREALKILGLNSSHIKTKLPPGILSQILQEATASNSTVLNNIVLRTMSKAKYSESPIGHYGLALDDYAHFTSPIRRYPDLVIHRILSDLLATGDERLVSKRYKKFVIDAAKQSSECEVTAMQVERACTDCYKAEYMQDHIGETFTGVISGATSYGIFVELPNTVEGLVRFTNFPNGEYDLVNPFEIKESNTGKSYKTGDEVQVTCVSSTVSNGKIDFAIA